MYAKIWIFVMIYSFVETECLNVVTEIVSVRRVTQVKITSKIKANCSCQAGTKGLPCDWAFQVILS